MVLRQLAWVDDTERASGKDAVVLLPSLGTTSGMFDEFVAEMAVRSPDVVTLRVDLPGHGSSPATSSVSVEDLAAELTAALAVLHARSIVVVGVSFGGAIAMEAARLRPVGLAGFVMINSGTRFGDDAGWRRLIDEVKLGGVVGLRESSARGWFSDAFRSSAPAHRILDALKGIDPAGYVTCCRALAAYRGDHGLDTLRVRALLIGTADDPATPAAQLRSAAVQLPHATYRELSHGRHLSLVEHAPVVADLVSEWRSGVAA